MDPVHEILTESLTVVINPIEWSYQSVQEENYQVAVIQTNPKDRDHTVKPSRAMLTPALKRGGFHKNSTQPTATE